MLGTTKRRTLVVTALAAMALTTTLLATPPAARAETPLAPQVAATVSHTNKLSVQVTRLMKGTGVQAEAKALETYWTPARMKAAKSLDQSSSLRLSGTAPRQSQPDVRPQGPAVKVAPQARTAPRVARPTGITPQTSFPNLPPSNPLARTNGKVFFSRSGANYVCSATVVNSEGKSLVWTAGHCVADGGAWSTNFAFVPAYSNGNRPYGTWYSRQLTTTGAWFYNRSFADDVAGATMSRNFGARIADYLGAQGIMWNQSAGYYANAFGYPQASPYNGAYLVQASGSTYNAGNGTIYMYSGMTGGSSGGAWLRNLSGSWGYVNGHNDFIYTNAPAWMYSPYYGNQVANVYNAVRYQTS